MKNRQIERTFSVKGISLVVESFTLSETPYLNAAVAPKLSRNKQTHLPLLTVPVPEAIKDELPEAVESLVRLILEAAAPAAKELELLGDYGMQTYFRDEKYFADSTVPVEEKLFALLCSESQKKRINRDHVHEDWETYKEELKTPLATLFMVKKFFTPDAVLFGRNYALIASKATPAALRLMRDPAVREAAHKYHFAHFDRGKGSLRFNDYEVSQELMEKYWDESKHYFSYENRVADFFSLPVKHPEFLAWLVEQPMNVVTTLKGRVPKTISGDDAVSLAKNLLHKEDPAEVMLDGLEVYYFLNRKFIENGLLHYGSVLNSILVDYRVSHVTVAFMKRLTEELQAGTYQVQNYREFWKTLDGQVLRLDSYSKWVKDARTLEEILSRLLEVTTAGTIVDIIEACVATKTMLTMKHVNEYIKNFDDYGSMPPSWWLPLVTNA